MPKTKKQSRPGRVLIALLVITLAMVGLLAAGIINKKTDGVPDLALDLEGGTQLILTPKAEEGAGRNSVTQEDIDQAIAIIRQRVDASGVSEAEITASGGQNIMVSLPGQPSEETLDLVRSSAQLDFRPVIQAGAPQAISAKAIAEAQKAQAKAQGKDPNSVKPSDKSTEELAKEQADQNHDGKISDEVSGKPSNPSDSKYITEKVIYDFLKLDCTDNKNRQGGSAGDHNKALVACSTEGNAKYILGPVDLEGTHVAKANSGMGQTQTGASTGKWEVSLQLDQKGTDKFAEVSKRLFEYKQTEPTKNAFAIVLDGLVVSAPTMNAIISDGRAAISGNFTQESAATLANQLQFGSLPLNFDVQSEQQISPTLGTDSLQWGLIAGLIGFVLIVIYLLWQYRALGLISIGSLVIAGILSYLTISLLSWAMGYRLSLAGVAGLIVAIGVTCDSFIVYFERIRDEVRDGRPLGAAVEEGWSRAKRTILASDAINMLAALVLYFLAVGGVQGFAFTLGITTLLDLLVVFMFTHPTMALLIRTKFFGEGHKWSGLDPEHLGATRRTYKKRNRRERRVVAKKTPGSTAVAEGELK
ncbi:protein translocase subunit SecD [Winkia sp. ACRQY]|uniref:Protein translocase subunit SecD n=1 Tax=Winkia neuii subsp. anitrata TaxID=29318 RepID=A0AB38XLK3_9ACTO|nr:MULTISPECIES: protein translocase subunit SecD [Winkia]MCG7301855.1 protein translocase subunit SecD [Winkia sp. ACRQY]MDK7162602.1 protein translocase subunit SecD [Winkia sp. UMB3105]MDK8594163.1 protein translocase subunit SecD [Winkia sp. UMB1096A]MDU2268824.1 protein translocase subunit SecD [Winkia neuii]WCE45176.1 protein translocase subunit SecD [Winkia neuii subsp. anitrata]